MQKCQVITLFQVEQDKLVWRNDLDLFSNELYTYRVLAVNDVGTGQPSKHLDVYSLDDEAEEEGDERDTVVAPTQELGTPNAPYVEVDGAKVHLSWSAVPAAQFYLTVADGDAKKKAKKVVKKKKTEDMSLATEKKEADSKTAKKEEKAKKEAEAEVEAKQAKQAEAEAQARAAAEDAEAADAAKAKKKVVKKKKSEVGKPEAQAQAQVEAKEAEAKQAETKPAKQEADVEKSKEVKAKQEAEAKKQTEEKKKEEEKAQSQAQAEAKKEAEKQAKAEAEQAKKKEEEAKKTEAKKAEAEKTKKEAEAKKAEEAKKSEAKAKKEADDAKKVEEEKKKAEAEQAKKKEAEAKKEAEKSKKEAEAKKAEEAKQAEAEQAAKKKADKSKKKDQHEDEQLTKQKEALKPVDKKKRDSQDEAGTASEAGTAESVTSEVESKLSEEGEEAKKLKKKTKKAESEVSQAESGEKTEDEDKKKKKKAKKLDAKVSKRSLSFEDGAEAELVVEVNEEDVEAEWTRDGQKLDASYTTTNEKNYCRLKFRAIATTGGTYVCKVKSKDGHTATVDFEVTVNEKPKVTVEESEVEVNAGESVQLYANISGHPPPICTWTKDGKALKADSKHSMKEKWDGLATLTTKNCQADSAGTYVLLAKNKTGETVVKIKLAVNDIEYQFRVSYANASGTGPASEPSDPVKCEDRKEDKEKAEETKKVEEEAAEKSAAKPDEGAGVEAKPEFTTKPEDLVVAKEKGKEIFSGKRQWIETAPGTSSLSIGEMREDDEGEIMIKLKNALGEASHSFKLCMDSPPQINRVDRYASAQLFDKGETVKLRLSFTGW
ncbi:unnamed protein product, partial [Mesorhabditis spiculigera]